MYLEGNRLWVPLSHCRFSEGDLVEHRGTQREHSSKPLKHSIVKRILVFKR